MKDSTSLSPLNRARMPYFDAMRGFCIIIVVFMHLMGRMQLGSYSTVLGTVLNTFFLPLFFFISGFFVYKACSSWTLSSLCDALKRKTQALVVCPLVFYTLYAYCSGNEMLGWMHWGFSLYWFTIVLFQFFLLYLFFSLIARVFRKEWLSDAGMAGTSGALLLLFIISPGDSTLWKVLCMENVCKYLQFFTLGILIQKYFTRFASLCAQNWFRTGCCVSFVVFLMLVYHEGFKTSGGMLYQAVHDIFIRYAGLLMVVCYFYIKRDFFEARSSFNTLLTHIGSRTLDIYMLHYFFLPELSFMKKWFDDTSMLVPQLFTGLFMSALVIAVCLLVSSFVRCSSFLSSWLFGVKPHGKRA